MEGMRRNRTSASLGAVLGILFAAGGALVAATLYEQRPIITVGLIGLILVPLGLILSGNARLLILWGLVFSLPLEFSKFFATLPHMGGEYAFRIEVSDLFLVLLVTDWLVETVRSGRRRITIPSSVWWWLGLMFLTGLTVLWGHWRRPALMEFVRMTKALVLFVYAANDLRRRGQLVHVATALAAGLLLQGLYGILQYFFDFSLGLERMGEAAKVQEEVAGESRSRVTALLGHPNLFSGFLAMVLPVPFAMLFAPVSRLHKLFFFASLLAGQASLVLTLSRNGWVSFAAAAGIVYVLTSLHVGIRARTRKMRVAVVVMAAAMLVAAGPIILQRFLRSKASNVSARWEMYDSAFLMIREKPILGFGKNCYVYAVIEDQRFRPGRASVYREEIYSDPRSVPPIHNIYLQQWIEQGTVGIVLFFVMLATIIRTGLRNLRIQDPTLFAMNAGALAGVLAILIHGLADWVFWWNGIMRIFWFLAGILFALDATPGPGSPAARRGKDEVAA